jgi:hypothetical protein
MDDELLIRLPPREMKTWPKRKAEEVHSLASIDTLAGSIDTSQRQNISLLITPTAGQTASSAVDQQLGAEVTRKNLSIQPTLKIPVGYRFNVRVNRDILFEAHYTPRRTVGETRAHSQSLFRS